VHLADLAPDVKKNCTYSLFQHSLIPLPEFCFDLWMLIHCILHINVTLHRRWDRQMNVAITRNRRDFVMNLRNEARSRSGRPVV
jgi:hypothetical protein